MIRLIQNELFKIFHQKKIYMFIFFFIVLVVATNYFKSISGGGFDNSSYYEGQIYSLNSSLKEVDVNSDPVLYAEILSDIKFNEILRENPLEWVEGYLSTYGYTIIYTYYYNLYVNGTDNPIAINNIEKYIESNSSVIYANAELDSATINLEVFVSKYKNLDSLSSDDELLYNNLKQLVYLAQYRIDNDISYNTDNYMNVVLIKLKDIYSVNSLNSFDSDDLEVYLYSLEEEIDLTSGSGLKGILFDFLNNYMQFIILFILMISAGVISDELNKGTIKTLLISPHSRTSIYLSKFFAVSIISLMVILLVFLLQIVVGIIVFGVNEIHSSVGYYDAASNVVVVEGILLYTLKSIIYFLPTLLILIIISLGITILIPSSTFAVISTFIGFMFFEVVNYYVIIYNLEFFKFLLSMNWDFTNYLNGASHPYEKINFLFSVIIYMVHFIFIMCGGIYLFKKKNIKNI